jgi:radical SAM protein with 4Fe4S-binding SPASM domain
MCLPQTLVTIYACGHETPRQSYILCEYRRKLDFASGLKGLKLKLFTLASKIRRTHKKQLKQAPPQKKADKFAEPCYECNIHELCGGCKRASWSAWGEEGQGAQVGLNKEFL